MCHVTCPETIVIPGLSSSVQYIQVAAVVQWLSHLLLWLSLCCLPFQIWLRWISIVYLIAIENQQAWFTLFNPWNHPSRELPWKIRCSSGAFQLRWSFRTLLSEVEINNATTPFIPKNTQRQTQWGVKVFSEWTNRRNFVVVPTSKKVSEQFLVHQDCVTSAQILNKWLTRFVLEETVKQDGSYYTSKSMYQLLCGLHRHMVKQFGESVPKFYGQEEPAICWIKCCHWQTLSISSPTWS